MKKLVRLEDVFAAFISAAGYGLGMAIPQAMGRSLLTSIISCIVFGTIMTGVSKVLVTSNWVRKSLLSKILTAVGVVCFFLVCVDVSEYLFHYSLWDDLSQQLLFFTIGASAAGFLISYVSEWVRTKYVLHRYDDGSDGHVMTWKERADVRHLIGTNCEITGKYVKARAIKTENGIFEGRKRGKTLEFLGIPYAKPPVGALRWKPPQKPEPSQKVWQAHYFGNSPIQMDDMAITLREHTQSEDCLTLNVWRAAKGMTARGRHASRKAARTLMPVLVIIHGGNLSFGGSAEAIYYGRTFVRKFPDVIVVSFNYRLGIMGFVDLAGTPGAEEYADSCNLGIRDQIMALQWVHDNIRAFGGDPGNVMLVGDTQGAGCIQILSTLKEAKGLFQKAMLISYVKSDFVRNAVSSVPTADDVRRGLGAKTMDELRKVSVEKIKNYMQSSTEWMTISPMRDGRLIHKDVERAVADGDTGDIKFIYGIPANEFSTWVAVSGEEDTTRWAMEVYNDSLELARNTKEEDEGRLTALLERNKKEGLSDEDAKINTLEFWLYRYSAIKNAIQLSRLGKSVHCFFWDVKSPVEDCGGNSFSAIGSLLGNKHSAANLGQVASDTLQAVFQQLVHNELVNDDPSIAYDEIKGVDGLRWDPFDEKDPAVLYFSNENVHMDKDVLAKDIAKVKEGMD